MERRREKGAAKLTIAKNDKSLPENIESESSSDAFNRFEGAMRAFGFRDNRSNSSGKKSNMCDGVQKQGIAGILFPVQLHD